MFDELAYFDREQLGTGVSGHSAPLQFLIRVAAFLTGLVALSRCGDDDGRQDGVRGGRRA
ncbi:hypothetical protein [Herbidospora cretacea]|uniref:hypothetical protein n=1 Tax=Herbidospora cretacea TaxID=28444 RepID=UPI000AB9648B|nr:hypothetical protein [Herbidospora cretacea]